ncbi:centriolin isoform X1 [Rhincodon typus]|uniref:centriolin isoform X1 n=1 Tax=Rhincodon typus TaxID=259920 RepID=UPI002030A7B8|nr:centriolin isoform X1 [Rhincodon typus]XP_048469674.1 centriolin isoform X1 [Rhincodon typus]
MRKRTPQQLAVTRLQASRSSMQTPVSSVLTPRTRSPSPATRSYTPDLCNQSTGVQKLDVSERSESESAVAYVTGKNVVNKNTGVRYITEDLIKKQSHEEQFSSVHSLNLCLSKETGKKFKFIENLEKCEQLLVLNLNNNLIEKIEKLDKQSKLRELSLSYNRICKIESLEHMVNLQSLKLAGNYIEQIPVWVGKKLRSLRILNLKQNNITSLQDIAKLKPLKELTSLTLANNPIARLPHYRLYVIYHLRSLNCLDGQLITIQERQEAHERFNLEELEKLEKELESKTKEIEQMEQEQSKAIENIKRQEQLNKSLKQEQQQQKNNYKELERELETKNELLKQKTAELTRACHKQYQLEQELAFYKIDAKFEPLHHFPEVNSEFEAIPNESPYIGKARYKRNLYIQEEHITDPVQHGKVGKIQFEAADQGQSEEVRAKLHQDLDVQLEDKEKMIQKAEESLKQLQNEKEKTQQQVLRTVEELKSLEALIAQKRVSEIEKDQLRQQLALKIQLINILRKETEQVRQQEERQRMEMEKKQDEIDNLGKILKSLDPKDPRHVHLKTQMTSKTQQLDMMSKQYKLLEKRLEEMLSKIAKETEDIKDLEEQLTEGRIVANEALKRDLEGVIAGLQEYLESVKGQAKQAREECTELQKEKEILLLRLADLEQQKNQLEIVAMDAEHLRKEMSDLEHSLQEQQELNESLRQAQGDLSEYEAELESQLQARDIEATQLREELERLRKLSQMEQSALQAELEKERQALENAIAQAQLVAEKEHENKKLVAQLKGLQIDNSLLKEQLQELQAHIDQAMKTMIHPEEVSARVSELRKRLDSGIHEIRPYNQGDTLGKNLAGLQKQLNKILGRSHQEKEEALKHQKKLEQEVMGLQDELKNKQEDYTTACEKAVETLMKSEKEVNEAKAQELKNEILQLQEQLTNMQELQALTDKQLQEADADRDKLLTEIEDKENKSKIEGRRMHLKLCGLEKNLKDLQETVATSEKVAAKELSTAKDHLKVLEGTVQKLSHERTEEVGLAEKFKAEATRAARDLAKAEAEIDMLQNLLKEKESQILDGIQSFDFGANTVNGQQLEIDRLNRALNQQRAELKHLQDHLEQTREGNLDEMEDLINEITALRIALGNQNDYITSMTDPLKRRGYWYFVPSAPKPSSLVSQNNHTKDSGFSSQYQVPPSSCQRSTPKRGNEEGYTQPIPRGFWVYSPIRRASYKTRTHTGDGEDSGTESDDSGMPRQPFTAPPSSVIYTMYPDGTPVPQGTVVYGPPPTATATVGPDSSSTIIYGPPPPGAHVAYGPPPANFTVPLIPAGVLHCNVLEHHDLENEVSRLEDIIAHLRSHKYEDQTSLSTDRYHEQIEQLRHSIHEILHGREELDHDIEELHKTPYKHSNQKGYLDGRLDQLMNELDMEKSLKRHDDVVDEIECLEITLAKRRAELRETDRLLVEAEADLKSTREKTKETVQWYDDARKHLIDTEKDAEELERRAQETAVKLVEAEQQLRLMKADLKDLEQHKTEQESILKEISKEISIKDSEFQAVTQRKENMTDILEKLQAEIHLAETKEKQHQEMLRETATSIQDKNNELESLNSKIEALQKELMMLDRFSGKKKEELRIFQNDSEEKKASLLDVLRNVESEVTDKQRHIRELKALLEEMSAQKGELNAQISEKNSQLFLSKQEVMNEEVRLQSLRAQTIKQKTELKHVLEMVQLENDELLELKQQHELKVKELDRIQAVLREEKSELENLQLTSQCQRAEIDHQKQLIEKDRQDVDQLNSKISSLQHNIESLEREKSHIKGSCLVLENKLTQAKKAFEATEDNNRNAAGKLQKQQTEISELSQEISQVTIQKEELDRKIGDMETCLQERKAELQMVMNNLRDTKDQLQLADQDLQNITKRRDVLKTEQLTLKENVNQSARKYQACLEKEKRKEQELFMLQQQIEEKQNELSEQQRLLQCLEKDIQSEEIKLEESASKVKVHLQGLEAELSDKREKFEQAVAKVNLMEERSRKLQHNEEHCTFLENQIATLKHQLSNQEQKQQEMLSELAFCHKEVEFSKKNLTRLQELIFSERKKAEKHIAAIKEESKAQRTQLEKVLNEQKHENNRLQNELSSRDQTAHDNHERTKRVMTELNEMRQEYFELKQQLRSQEQLEHQQKEIKEAIRTLRSDVKAEISSSLKDLDQSCMEPKNDPDKIWEEEMTLHIETGSLKDNVPFARETFDERLSLTRFNFKDEQWRGDVLRENLRQQEDHLKAQIRQCMSKQAETLCKRKQQTEGNLTSLKRRVDALDELVTSTNVDSFHQYKSSSNNGQSKSLLHGIVQSSSRNSAERSLQPKSTHLHVAEVNVSENDAEEN